MSLLEESPDQKSAKLCLLKELKKLTKENNHEGYHLDEKECANDIFNWKIGIFGPPNTLFEGGYFKAEIVFPTNYPFSPPKFIFTPPIYHPNIYTTGEVCISLLHELGQNNNENVAEVIAINESRGEDASEQWSPVHSVNSIIMSVIVLLNEPNIESPANINASKSYQKYLNGEKNDYESIIRSHVQKSILEAEENNIKIPKTDQEYWSNSASKNRNKVGLNRLPSLDYEDSSDE